MAARGILRQLLACYLPCAPQDFAFHYNEHGKPNLVSPLQFNVSHSNEWAVYAFCLNQLIGIDIEQQKESVDGLALAQRFFSVAEYEHLQALPPPQQSDYFFQLWAYKEAFIKALGAGLSFPLADFTVSFDETSANIQQHTMDTQLWHLYPITVAENYNAAIATEGKVDKIEMWEL
jgi:4'-phosphopantetheinyl transferase